MAKGLGRCGCGLLVRLFMHTISGNKVGVCVVHVPVDEIAQVIEQFRVVLQSQVSPREGGVLALRSHVGEVETPNVRWNAGVFSHVSKHSHTTAL